MHLLGNALFESDSLGRFGGLGRRGLTERKGCMEQKRLRTIGPCIRIHTVMGLICCIVSFVIVCGETASSSPHQGTTAVFCLVYFTFFLRQK